MALGNITQQGYYKANQIFQGDGSNREFTLTTDFFNPLPETKRHFLVYIDNVLRSPDEYEYSKPKITFNTLTFGVNTIPPNTSLISVELAEYDKSYGDYQNLKLTDIVNNFIMGYVGDGKLLKNTKKSDVLFHAQRGIQELNYDTLRSEKSQEIEVPPSLSMPIPHDYVNYVKVSGTSNKGDEYVLFPIRKSSNPTAVLQDSDYNYIFDSDGRLTYAQDSELWKNYKKNASTSTFSTSKNIDWYTIDQSNLGGRYGLHPEFTQDNGGFLVDQVRGLIHFTSNMSGRLVILKYISEGLYSDEDTVIHKFAEDAIYKYIAHALLSTRINTPEYIIRRYRREKRAAIRNAKLRLSNLKLEELTQVMRGKSKHIK